MNQETFFKILLNELTDEFPDEVKYYKLNVNDEFDFDESDDEEEEDED